MTNERTDPLRTISMNEVCRRTGIGRRDIYRRLALDEMHGTRGVEFAAPLGGRLQGRQLKWREVTVVKWLERLEVMR
jgi:predicted DNA-binding transcriptional regulator AlpA